MEKKTMDALRAMLCGEIEDIAKKGNLTHESLDILKDLIETEKNLGKIEHYDKEKEESQALMIPGYSQRKYYIDADYQPGHMSYAGPQGSYNMGGGSYGMGGNSYGGRMVYDVDRNSYMYMTPQYDQSMARGYSRTGSKTEMVEELKEMMNETTDQTVKTAIQDAIAKMNK